MKEPHNEGVANHADLESCAGDGDIAGEALTSGTGGPAIEPRNTQFRAPTLWTADHVDRRGRPHLLSRHRERPERPARSVEPVHVRKLSAREPGDLCPALLLAGR